MIYLSSSLTIVTCEVSLPLKFHSTVSPLTRLCQNPWWTSDFFLLLEERSLPASYLIRCQEYCYFWQRVLLYSPCLICSLEKGFCWKASLAKCVDKRTYILIPSLKKNNKKQQNLLLPYVTIDKFLAPCCV